jgi:hypothetical protein
MNRREGSFPYQVTSKLRPNFILVFSPFSLLLVTSSLCKPTSLPFPVTSSPFFARGEITASRKTVKTAIKPLTALQRRLTVFTKAISGYNR